MRIKIVLFALIWLIACQSSRTTPTTTMVAKPPTMAVSCADCPNHSIALSPYRWPNYTAIRFFYKGLPLEPKPFSAARTPADASLFLQFQFGSIYFMRGNANVSGQVRTSYVACGRGRDTMVVAFRPDNWKNMLYDSIEFKKGFYYITPSKKQAAGPLLRKALAIYFDQHEVDLAQQNPFSECRFKYNELDSVANPKKFVPATPADIFRLLLQHTSYLQAVHCTLRPFTKGHPIPRD